MHHQEKRHRIHTGISPAAVMPSSKVMLRSQDGVEFETEEAVAKESQTIKRVIEEGWSRPIPLKVNSNILHKVLEYCRKHADRAAVDDELVKVWDAEYVKVDQEVLFDLVQAAEYLNIKGLLDLTCEKVADLIKGKTPEEIRELFNIENRIPPEEEEIMRQIEDNKE